MTTSSFIEFIQHICKRPAMYTGGSVKETLAFIDGYRFGNATPISGRLFDQFVCIRNSFPSNYVWGYVITTCSKDDEEALQLIIAVITEFIQLKEKMSDDELIQYAKEQLVEETEAEKIFRQFDEALLTGNESVIRQLIENHKDAEILWKEAYPTDVAHQLKEISVGQSIKSIPLTADRKQVRIIASGWPFPIEINFTNGEWRINAAEIIGLRLSNK